MREIQNKTARPIRIPLPGGRFLHVGPGQIGQINDHAASFPGVLELIKEGSIEFLGERERHSAAGGRKVGRQETHGRMKPFRRGQGDR